MKNLRSKYIIFLGVVLFAIPFFLGAVKDSPNVNMLGLAVTFIGIWIAALLALLRYHSKLSFPEETKQKLQFLQDFYDRWIQNETVELQPMVAEKPKPQPPPEGYTKYLFHYKAGSNYGFVSALGDKIIFSHEEVPFEDRTVYDTDYPEHGWTQISPSQKDDIKKKSPALVAEGKKPYMAVRKIFQS